MKAHGFQTLFMSRPRSHSMGIIIRIDYAFFFFELFFYLHVQLLQQ